MSNTSMWVEALRLASGQEALALKNLFLSRRGNGSKAWGKIQREAFGEYRPSTPYLALAKAVRPQPLTDDYKDTLADVRDRVRLACSEAGIPAPNMPDTPRAFMTWVMKL